MRMRNWISVVTLAGAGFLLSGLANAQQTYRIKVLSTPPDLFLTATGLNNRGHVAGIVDHYPQDAHIFIYRHGRLTDLGTLGGDVNSRARINDRDEIVATSTRAFVWRNGTFQDLTPLGAASALDINNRGQITGQSTNGRAYRITNGLLQDLGVPGRESEGFVINERGNVAGSFSNGGSHAFLYKQGKVLDISAPGEPSWVDGMNDKDQVSVGHYDEEPSFGDISLWTNGVLSPTYWEGSAPVVTNVGDMIGTESPRIFYPDPVVGIRTGGRTLFLEELIDNTDPLKGDAWFGGAADSNVWGQVLLNGQLRSRPNENGNYLFVLTPVSFPRDLLNERLEQLRGKSDHTALLKALRRAHAALNGADQPLVCRVTSDLVVELNTMARNQRADTRIANEIVADEKNASDLLGCGNDARAP